jgi:hypothetical protein
MRSVHRTLWAPSFLANTLPNLALLFRTGFRSIRRSEIHTNIKDDLDALNRCRRLFYLWHTSYLSRTVIAVSWLLRIGVRQILLCTVISPKAGWILIQCWHQMRIPTHSCTRIYLHMHTQAHTLINTHTAHPIPPPRGVLSQELNAQ